MGWRMPTFRRIGLACALEKAVAALAARGRAHAMQKPGCKKVLRIQVRELGEECTLIVEGEIEGVSAIELEWCWRNLACRQNKTVIVDLGGVLRVGREGRRVLTAMHHGGVRFTEARLAMQDTLDQITASESSTDNKT